MKANNLFITLLIIIIGVFYSCTNKTNNKEIKLYNGIDSQILNIVDSIPFSEDMPFITVWFTMCNDSNRVIRIFNGMLIPAPDPPPSPPKRKIISENNIFKGYKIYDSIYVVFLESNPNGSFEEFVKKDSLCFDEKPFVDFNVYEYNGKQRSELKAIELKYLINEKDSLVKFEGKCMFDIE